MSHQPSLKHISPKDTPKHLHIPTTDSFRPVSPCSVSSSRRGTKTPSKMVRSGAETPSSFSSVYLQNLSHMVLKPNSTHQEPSNTTSRTNDNPLFRPLVKQYSLDHHKMLKAVKSEPKKNSNSFSPKKHLSNEKKGSPVHEQSTFSTIAAQRVSEAQFFKSTNTDLINREASTKSPQKRIAINRSQRASHGHDFHDIMQRSSVYSPAEKFNNINHHHPDQKEEQSYVSIRKMKQEYYESPRSIRSQGGYHFSKRTSTDFSLSVHQSELSSRHLQTENYSQFDDKAYLHIPSSPLTVRESSESEGVTETLHTDVSLIDMLSNPHHKSSPTNQGITEGFSSFHKNRPDYNHKIFSPSIRKSKIEIIKQHLDEPKTVDVILIDGKWRSINDVQEISNLQQSLAESVSRNNADQNTQKRRPVKSRSTHQLDLLHVVGDKHSEHQVKSQVIDDAPKKTNNFKKQKSHDNLVKKPHKIDDLFTHHKRSEATTPKIDDLFTHHKRNEAKTTQIHVLPPQNEEHTISVSSYIENQERVGSDEKLKKANYKREYLNESESIPKIQELPQKEEESATSISNNPFIQEETEKPKRANLNRETVPQSESSSVVSNYSSPQQKENSHEVEEKTISEEKPQNQDFEYDVQTDKREEAQDVQAEVNNFETQIQNEIPTQQQKQEETSVEENSNEEKVYQNDLHADIIGHHIKCPVEDVICEVEEEQETGNEDPEIDQTVEDKIPQEEESIKEEALTEEKLTLNSSTAEIASELIQTEVRKEEEKPQKTIFEIEQKQKTASTEISVPIKAEVLIEEQSCSVVSEKESLYQPILNSSTAETASEIIKTEERKEEEKSEQTICEVEQKQEIVSTVQSVQEEDESRAPIKSEALALEKQSLSQPTLNSSTVETPSKLIETEVRKEEEKPQKTICEVEEKQETNIAQEKKEESIIPVKVEEQNSEKENENQPILNSSTAETASELIKIEENPQKTTCDIEQKQESASTITIAQQKEESNAPIKIENLTSEKENLSQPILNSSAINTASEFIETEVRKEEEKPQKTICEIEQKQETVKIVQEEEESSAPIKASNEEQRSNVILEKENSHQLNIHTSTVESTPKLLHTEERKEEEKLSQDGSQTDKKAHDLSSPSSFLESEDRIHTHDWNHLIGDSLKIKKFGEHYPSSQNGLDDHEHEQDMTTIFEENIAKFETLKKLNNQDGAVHLLKEVSDDLERYVQEKAKPQEEATAKVLKLHVYNRLGVEYYEKGLYEETLQQCKKSLEIDHSNIQALFKLYQTNSKLGKREQASNVIKRVRKIMQNPFLYQYNQQFILDKFTMPTQTNSQSNQSLQDMHDSRLSFF